MQHLFCGFELGGESLCGGRSLLVGTGDLFLHESCVNSWDTRPRPGKTEQVLLEYTVGRVCLLLRLRRWHHFLRDRLRQLAIAVLLWPYSVRQISLVCKSTRFLASRHHSQVLQGSADSAQARIDSFLRRLDVGLRSEITKDGLLATCSLWDPVLGAVRGLEVSKGLCCPLSVGFSARLGCLALFVDFKFLLVNFWPLALDEFVKLLLIVSICQLLFGGLFLTLG